MSDVPRERYLFIDGLRGLAALAVAWFHLYLGGGAVIHETNPQWLLRAFSFGRCGVFVFFVISGFVIAHALPSCRTLGAVLRFFLRRSIRLDPTYWTSMVVALACIPLFARFTDHALPSLNTTDVAANAVYLQDLLSRQPACVVYWSLCQEFQLYLAFAVLLWLTGRIVAWMGASEGGARLACFLPASFVACAWTLNLAPRMDAWFLQYWHYYLLGTFCCWALRSPSGKFLFVSMLMVELLALGVAVVETGTAIGPGLSAVLTGVALYTAGRLSLMGKMLKSAPWQYLGRLSYAVYLLHATVGLFVVEWIKAHTVAGEAFLPTLGAIVAGMAATVGASHLLYAGLERRCVGWSRKVRLQAAP